MCWLNWLAHCFWQLVPSVWPRERAPSTKIFEESCYIPYLTTRFKAYACYLNTCDSARWWLEIRPCARSARQYLVVPACTHGPTDVDLPAQLSSPAVVGSWVSGRRRRKLWSLFPHHGLWPLIFRVPEKGSQFCHLPGCPPCGVN